MSFRDEEGPFWCNEVVCVVRTDPDLGPMFLQLYQFSLSQSQGLRNGGRVSEDMEQDI